MARFPLPPAEPMRLVSLAEIARGGMGSVELVRVDGGAFHGQLLAIKRLHPNIAQDPQFVGMFLDEAWMTAALKSPNVVHVAAWGNDDKGMFLAVEFVQGVSLSRLIKESQTNKEPFAERTVANIGSQICAGLVAAHTLKGPDGAPLGLVHRDLTPGNLLVSFEGVVKIADFGIAKAEERITHTRTGTLKGKPSYMAPEQARGGKVDGRADLFSFGVVMFELLAGRRPWVAKSAFDVMMDIATTPAPDLREVRKGVNPMFAEIVEKCLQKKPDDRFGSAGEIQKLLDGWRQQKTFAHDDQKSLGHFVVRNSAAQIKWFEDAMRGENQRSHKSLSFKELEEQIDLERETTAARKGLRRSSGSRPALASVEDAMPSGRPSTPGSAGPRDVAAPAPAPPPPPSFRQMADPPPGRSSGGLPAVRLSAQSSGGLPAARPSGQSSGGLPAVRPSGQSSGGLAAVQPPSSGGYPVPSSHGGLQSKNLGGTEYMAQSPFPSSPHLPVPAGPGSSAQSPNAGTMLMPASSSQMDPRRASYPGRIAPPRLEATVIDPRGLAQAQPAEARHQPAEARHQPAEARRQPAEARPQPAEARPEPAWAEPKKGGAGVWVLLLLLLLGGASGAAWYFRAQIAPDQFGRQKAE